MFIKPAPKKDKITGITYTYYRLAESFRLDGKTRHRNILNLGTLDELKTVEQRKQLADKIEALYKNLPDTLFPVDITIDKLARRFVTRLRELNALGQTALQEPAATTSATPASQQTTDFENIDLNSLKHDQVRELGAEWLCKQAITQLKIPDMLKQEGFSNGEINMAVTQIISRAVFPGSELKTQNRIQENSAVSLLQDIEPSKVSRRLLYQSALKLYDHKVVIEKHLCKTTSELFHLDDKLMLYDLTNTYFEGRKLNSKMAQFGRSKEKRSDCKLIVLALVVSAEGFVKSSRLFEGNSADCTTLAIMLELMSGQKLNDPAAEAIPRGNKPIIGLDAGIATEDNIKLLEHNGYDYISVSRGKLPNYTLTHIDPVMITDNRKHPIELNLVCEPAENGDRFLYVHSQLKEAKEAAMDTRACAKLETELKSMAGGLSKKGTVKKMDSILLRIGRIKERHKAVSRYFDIKVTQKDGKATALTWTVSHEDKNENNGIYFLRTSLQQKDEKTLWKIYNTLTEIEATFRILKTDLEMRPVFHQKDKATEAHLFLAILAYSLVATIRYQLKQAGINDSWKEIVRKMNTQKLVTTSMKNDKGKTIIIQRPSEPTQIAKEIYDALKYKPKPWTKKKFVLPDL
jgi:transposase